MAKKSWVKTFQEGCRAKKGGRVADRNRYRDKLEKKKERKK